MRQWSNFYFWSTWTLLICLFILIFHMYLSEFRLEKIIDTITLYFIDVKTILTVLGTIFGAYFGAKVAGKYAVDSVERQIEEKKSFEEKKEKRSLLRCLYVYDAHTELISDLLDKLLAYMELETDSDFRLSNPKRFDPLFQNMTSQFEILENVDISNIFSNEYFVFLMTLDDCKVIKQLFGQVELSIQNNNYEQYKSTKESLYESLKELKKRCLEIQRAIIEQTKESKET